MNRDRAWHVLSLLSLLILSLSVAAAPVAAGPLDFLCGIFPRICAPENQNLAGEAFDAALASQQLDAALWNQACDNSAWTDAPAGTGSCPIGQACSRSGECIPVSCIGYDDIDACAWRYGFDQGRPNPDPATDQEYPGRWPGPFGVAYCVDLTCTTDPATTSCAASNDLGPMCTSSTGAIVCCGWAGGAASYCKEGTGCVACLTDAHCTGGRVCDAQGQCVTPCTNECTSGATSCVLGSLRTCGNYDADACTEWSSPVVCPTATCASAFACATGGTCANECVAGTTRCSVISPVGVQTCGNYDTDACTEWGGTVACSAGTACVGGACVATCTNECVAGATSCVAGALRTCVNYDLDTCAEWSAPSTCPTGTCADATSCVVPACASPAQCDDGNACTSDACTAGACAHAPAPVDTPCGPAGAQFCDGIGTCVECTVDAQCPAGEACVGNTCVPTGSCDDKDGDGYAVPVRSAICTGPTDCDDTDASVHPGATEWCDGVDNDCDGTIDDACQSTRTCTDTDGGIVPNIAGEVADCPAFGLGPCYLHDDQCLPSGGPTGGYLEEWYCADSVPANESLFCPFGCLDGACLPEPTAACSDGFDNDGDGAIDAYDPGCAAPDDDDETDGSDYDGDTCADAVDAFPTIASPDTDGDGFHDDCDNCFQIVNPAQEDADNDGLGDMCDASACLPGQAYCEINPLCQAIICPGICENACAGVSACDTNPCDGCSATAPTCGTTCGDGVINGVEACDDGNDDPYDACGTACTLCPVIRPLPCPDGQVYNFPGDLDGDGCGDMLCVPAAACGDGTIQPGEECDSDAPTITISNQNVLLARQSAGVYGGSGAGFEGITADFTQGTVTLTDSFISPEGFPSSSLQTISLMRQSDGTYIGDDVLVIVFPNQVWGPILSCQSLDSFTGGNLSCDPATCLFDTFTCAGPAVGGTCGDGIIQVSEDCDGANWTPIDSCTDFDTFSGGRLSCGATCHFDTSNCIPPASTCGNGVLNAGEQCDDGDTQSGDGCSAACDLEYYCGDGIINPGEECDGTNLGPIDACVDLDTFQGGAISCTTQCRFNTTQCVPPPAGVCGNGIIEPGEQCDGAVWGPIDACADFDTFTGGTLSCDATCRFNTSSCTPPPAGVCGNGIIEPGESCDTYNAGPIDSC